MPDGRPTQRYYVGSGQVSFDLGPSQIAVAVADGDGSWSGWVVPLADEIREDPASCAPSRNLFARVDSRAGKDSVDGASHIVIGHSA